MGRRYARAGRRASASAPAGSCMIGRCGVLTWNVAGRVRRQPEQAAAVAAIGADVVALQEVTARTLPLWRAALADAGLAHVETRAGRARRDAAAAAARRAHGRARAARAPPAAARRARGPSACSASGRRRRGHQPPLADRARARAGQGPHPRGGRRLPRGAPARARGSSAATSTRRAASCPTATCSPSPTTARGRLRPERGERWDAAERALVHDLRASTAGPTPTARCTATATARRAGRSRNDRGGWRLDHVLVHGLEPVACCLRPRVAPRGPQRPLGAGRRPRLARRAAGQRAPSAGPWPGSTGRSCRRAAGTACAPGCRRPEPQAHGRALALGEAERGQHVALVALDGLQPRAAGEPVVELAHGAAREQLERLAAVGGDRGRAPVADRALDVAAAQRVRPAADDGLLGRGDRAGARRGRASSPRRPAGPAARR